MTRAILSALVLLVLPAAARADVFVPADPPVASAECIAGERDVLALGLEPGEVGVLSGGSSQLIPGLDLCPVVAAAADGTAAVASGPLESAAQMTVRRPGGAFGPPVTLASSAGDLRVAVAPGGWAAAAWFTLNGLRARVFAPDGTSRTAVLERELGLAPRIGIDASGRATAVWMRWDPVSGRYALRVARSTGTAWSAASTLGTGRTAPYAIPIEALADDREGAAGARRSACASPSLAGRCACRSWWPIGPATPPAGRGRCACSAAERAAQRGPQRGDLRHRRGDVCGAGAGDRRVEVAEVAARGSDAGHLEALRPEAQQPGAGVGAGGLGRHGRSVPGPENGCRGASLKCGGAGSRPEVH